MLAETLGLSLQGVNYNGNVDMNKPIAESYLLRSKLLQTLIDFVFETHAQERRVFEPRFSWMPRGCPTASAMRLPAQKEAGPKDRDPLAAGVECKSHEVTRE